jgi:hypothetical protein
VGEKALEVSAERESRIFVDCQLARPAIKHGGVETDSRDTCLGLGSALRIGARFLQPSRKKATSSLSKRQHAESEH